MTNRVLLVIALLMTRTGFGQTPPNDNFADRTVLAGNNIVFTGDLSGSTIEPNEPVFDGYYFPSTAITHSVWWSWTATESGPVTLAALTYSEDTYIQGYGDG